MRVPVLYNPTAVAVAIALIVISTVTLSLVSYHYTVGRENLTETSLVQTNIKLANQTVDRIEQKIIDNDRILAEMIDVNEPDRWPAMADAILKADLNVEQVYFFKGRSNYPVYPAYSESIKNSWGAMRAAVRELDPDHMVPNQIHHLHKERPDNYFFVSYMVRENAAGEKILVCYQMSFEKIVALLNTFLRDLQTNFYVSIVDFDNVGVYNEPRNRSGKYFYEMRFPTTLYKWILQVVPRNYTEIESSMRNQRRTNLFFIILSSSLTFFSLVVIYAASRRERQLRKLKEDFIGNVSHELKTPLSLIRMFSEILATGRVKADKTKQEYYDIIHTESDRMTYLINNLLDFASLERGGKRRQQFEATNVAQLITRQIEAYRYKIQSEGFQVTAEIDSGIPDTLADPNSITMAFFNLLDNSVKYSGERKCIRVRVRRSDGFVDVAVQDDGLGIPAGEQQKVFEKFYRGSNAVNRKIRGSGIGLSITKHVAEMHGGTVLVESEPGKGSTFTLRIPIRTAPQAAA